MCLMMREDTPCRDCDVGILNFIFQVLLLSIDNSLPDYKNSNQNNESSHSARKARSSNERRRDSTSCETQDHHHHTNDDDSK